jgi:hypothetical protein
MKKRAVGGLVGEMAGDALTFGDLLFRWGGKSIMSFWSSQFDREGKCMSLKQLPQRKNGGNFDCGVSVVLPGGAASTSGLSAVACGSVV